MTSKPYLALRAHYEACLDRHGDTCRGVDWPNAEDAERRYRVMLDVIRAENPEWEQGVAKVRLLDLGCGASHLLDYISRNDLPVDYTGMDISQKFIDLSRSKHPGVVYHCLDLLDAPEFPERFDYVVMNGVFTEKLGMKNDEMFNFMCRMLEAAFRICRRGVAFNVMSKQVDWERDDLFHCGFDQVAWFMARNLSRKFIFRNDYGLYEYTTYVYR